MILQGNALKDFSYSKLANFCGVSQRAFLDWRTGKYLIPLSAFKKLSRVSNFYHSSIKIFPNHWHIKNAAKKGGLRRYEKYGNLGTKEGRRRGGKATCQKFLKNALLAKQVGFKIREKIRHPGHSVKLAELMGIILGDGGITRTQVAITLNKIDDRQFSIFVGKLIKNLLKIEPSVYKRESIVSIVISRVEFVKFLLRQRFCVGSKVRNQIGVPVWIRRNRRFTKACMRGLLDTDGCVYIDRHVCKNRVYLNCGLNFTNRSLPLLDFFKVNLEAFGFHPTQKTKFSVFLRREEEIARYFEEIGSSNPKHLGKIELYFKNKYGGVPKWS